MSYSDVPVGSFKAPEAAAPATSRYTRSTSQGTSQVHEPAEAKPPVDRRVLEWKAAWEKLYARKLPRAEHEVERDKMLDWARDRGRAVLEQCIAGLLRSGSYDAPMSAEDRALMDAFEFDGSRK